MDRINELFKSPLKVINIGLHGFADDIKAQGAEVTDLDWSPPAGGNRRMADLLKKLK